MSTDETTATLPARPTSRLTTLVLALGLAASPAVALGFARFAYGLLLPGMRADLAWTYLQAGLMNTANAGGYLAGHPQLGRFYAFLLMFMASMLGLVLADNLLTLFVF